MNRIGLWFCLLLKSVSVISSSSSQKLVVSGCQPLSFLHWMVVFTFHFLLLKVKWTGVRAIFRIYPNWNNPPPPFFLLAFLFIKDQSRKPSNEIVPKKKKKIWYITSQEEREKNLKAKRDSHRYSRSNLERPLVLSGQWFFFILILMCVWGRGGAGVDAAIMFMSPFL